MIALLALNTVKLPRSRLILNPKISILPLKFVLTVVGRTFQRGYFGGML